MLLYTNQRFDLRTFNEPIDVSRSAYLDDYHHHVRRAYRWLYRTLATDQFMWCSQQPPERLPGQRPESRFDHVLDADLGDIVAVVSGERWRVIYSRDFHASVLDDDAYDGVLKTPSECVGADQILLKWRYSEATTLVSVESLDNAWNS